MKLLAILAVTGQGFVQRYKREDKLNPNIFLVAASIDCYGADANGGCSHVCNADSATHVCECPACWELEDDAKTCRPASDKVTTQCTMNELIVTVNKCVFAAHNYETARLNDGNCKFEQNPDNQDEIVLKTGLDDCGTVLDFGDDAITYKVI